MDEERRESANSSSEPEGQRPSGIPHSSSGQSEQSDGQTQSRIPWDESRNESTDSRYQSTRAGNESPRSGAESTGASDQSSGAGNQPSSGGTPYQSGWQQPQTNGQYRSGEQSAQSSDQYRTGAQSAPSGSQYQTGSQYGTGSQYQSGSQYQAGQYQAGGQYGASQYGSSTPQYSGYSAEPEKQKKPAKKGPGWGALVVAMILTASVAVLGTLGVVKYSDVFAPRYQTQQSQNAQQPKGDKTNVIEVQGTATDWEKVAEAVRPATVTIQVASGNSGDTGSGVVWDTEGNIVTNYHVVSSAAGSSDAQITVAMSGGRLFEAKIVGLDSTTDLAVIKLVDPPSDLVAANFGDSSDLSVGQSVMAIGSPLGLSDTVTTGIISALDRPVAVKTAVPNDQQENFNYQFPFFQREQTQSETVITNAIQVDASINPGNSGGPLFDQSGHVIGINSSIASMGSEQGNSGSIGLGFAIPVNLVKNVATQLIETGEAQHAQLGVTISSAAVTVDGVTRLGAEVQSILPGGAAAGADIKEGDVIVSIDGNDVTSSRALTGYVRRYNAGDVVTIGLARGGTLHEVQVELQAQ